MKNQISQIAIIVLIAILVYSCNDDEENMIMGEDPIGMDQDTMVMEEDPMPETEVELSTRTVISTLSIPWEILWGPDDYIWLTERNGLISRLNPETGEKVLLLNMSSKIEQTGESGLLGMALHPDFGNNPYVYLVYTYFENGAFLERLVRFTYMNNSLENETILLDNIEAFVIHSGSRIRITSDLKILMTTGDVGNANLSQDFTSLSGKLLRINLDGSIPSDNPDPNSYIYSTGHRNAQGLVIHPNGKVYSSEHGPDTDDEINIIKPMGNYGWPNVLGEIDTPVEEAFAQITPVEESILHWTPTVAVSDLILYTSDSIPQWKNKLLLTTLKDRTLIAITLSEDGNEVIEQERLFENEFGRLRDVVMSPDGRVFIATNGNSYTDVSSTHKIIEIARKN